MTEYEKAALSETEQRSKLNEIQLSEIKADIREIKEENKALYELTASVKLIANDMGSIKESVDGVKKDMSEVKGKIVEIEHAPNKKTADTWDKVKVAVMSSSATFLALGILGSIIFFVGK